MKPNCIILTDKGIGCFEAPDPDSFGALEYREYNKALEAAMKQAVLFKIEHDYPILPQLYGILEKGKLYPVPDGYEIKIETYSIYNGKDNPSIEYAILVPKHVPVLHPTMGHELNPLTKIEFVPKEEIMAEKFWSNIEKSYAHVKQPTIKQPTSIEENKWCDSCGKRTTWINGECENYKNKSSIEEAAEAYADSQDRRGTGVWQGMYRGFIAGAKQREANRSYQINEANELIKYVMENTIGDHTCWLSPRRRKQFEKYATQFKQFKQEKKNG